MNLKKVRAKALLGLQLTAHERAVFILYGPKQEVDYFLSKETNHDAGRKD